MFSFIKRVMSSLNQNQQSGDNSTNLQAREITLHQGISYSDAKEIANDVFKANFIVLKQEAALIAQNRAEEVTEKVISQLESRHPDSLNQFQTPALQNALFTVQKQYAISGDQDLGDLLVDILVDRAASPKRDMVQIVLDESLGVAPKLTLEQFDTLTLNFLFTKHRRLDVKSYQDLIAHFKNRVIPFSEKLSDKHSDYSHLEYLGCGYVRAGNYGQLEAIIRTNYKAFFSKGFSEAELEEVVGTGVNVNGLIMRCLHDPRKLQLTALDDDILENIADRNGLSSEVKQNLKQLFESSTKTVDEIKEMLITAMPEMERVFDVWVDSPFDQFELTSVGIAIAHANYRRRIKESMDLSIWIK